MPDKLLKSPLVTVKLKLDNNFEYEFIIDSDPVRLVTSLLIKFETAVKAAPPPPPPAEVIVGTFKLTGDMKGPDPRWSYFADQTTYMGQALFDPPSVEGWHTGKEWVNSGSFINRVNFMSEQFKNINSPGIIDTIKRLKNSNIQSASGLLDK